MIRGICPFFFDLFYSLGNYFKTIPFLSCFILNPIVKYMNTTPKPIPEGFTSITPYLTVKDGVKAIEFYKKAFGATEIGRITMPDGTLGHAELKIGNARIMLADQNDNWGNKSPHSLGGSPISICLYVEDVDTVFAKALNEGATVKNGMEVKDQYYGDRSGTLTDPFGHEWSIMTHIEDISYDILQAKTNAMVAKTNI